jgi:hypothetical protein
MLIQSSFSVILKEPIRSGGRTYHLEVISIVNGTRRE